MPSRFENACMQNKGKNVNSMLHKCQIGSVKIRTHKCMSLLMLACADGAVDVCRFLIANNIGADDIQKKPAFFYCVENNQKNVLQFFLKKCVDVNARDEKRNTALNIAAKVNNLDIVKLLKSKP